ncbi:LysE/ArgO family amino acid transporter [Methylobrevis pamukkalensis]|uniref:Arginine exporter protein ArgO n=1 Tax=Methylobrevis pamukkalensis TaxID=1439726 RepID=A0A1E3H6Q0_9HYPH|nr:LysE/ArgO family amino acid transporter [Methylobrevis pamukkalensis]ODN72007.1 Arginine exporter protein ArgO [Methylobrevis pamukkalensis]
MSLSAAVEGFGLGASLIIAIGAQNAFVLRQGLVKSHVGPLVAFCALSDAALIALGAAGMGTLVNASGRLFAVLAFAGMAMLGWYGIAAARRVFAPGGLEAARGGPMTLAKALTTAAILTWANPHVYIDTVVLLGGISGRYPVDARLYFAGGAMLASVVWFSALGYGARLLAPVFERPLAWRILDAGIALVMLSIAAGLGLEGIAALRG